MTWSREPRVVPAAGAAAAVVGLALALSGCGANGERAVGDSTESPTAEASVSVGTSWTPGAGSGSDPSGSSSGAPALDGVLPAAADPADAVAPAQAALTAWARPDLGAVQWWDGFSPFLSDRGLQAYEATDPSTIPALQVTGPASLAPANASGLTLVDVPTTAGLFGVQVVWSADGWAVDRIYFPDTPRPE